MNVKIVTENLKRGRRSLDAIYEVTILQDWQYEFELEKWFIKISLDIKSDINGVIKNNSIWFVVVSEIP